MDTGGEMAKKQTEQIAEGLTILAKYDINGYGTCVEHDQIWAGPDNARSVSQNDKKALKALGWVVDSDVKRWTFHV